jgi:hypothetical protein
MLLSKCFVIRVDFASEEFIENFYPFDRQGTFLALLQEFSNAVNTLDNVVRVQLFQRTVERQERHEQITKDTLMKKWEAPEDEDSGADL